MVHKISRVSCIFELKWWIHSNEWRIIVFLWFPGRLNPFQKMTLIRFAKRHEPRSISPYRIQWGFVGSCRNPWYWIPIGSRRTSESVGTSGFRQDSRPFRHFQTSDDFLSESNTKDSDSFRQTLTGSDNFPIGSNCRIVRPGKLSQICCQGNMLEKQPVIQNISL